MTKTKKSNLLPKGKRINKKGLATVLSISLIIGLLIGLILYKTKDNELIGSTIYYTGDIYSANHAANMLDYLDEGNNIILSPINVNSSLAILYNGTDNNSNKELKRYFKKNPHKINEEMNNRLSTLNAENKPKNKFNILYESYINEINNKAYNNLTLSTISLLSKDQKEELILLLRKTELTYNRIHNRNNYSEKTIKEYKLTSEELMYNNYNIKELLDAVISDNESYNIVNEVHNHTGIYVNNLDKSKVEKEFIADTSIYNYDLEPINNEATLARSNINRMIDHDTIGHHDIIITNNLYFNYSWNIPFHQKNIKDAEFYNIDNKVQAVEMMYTNQTTYLENSKAKGFKYDFENGKYSFVGILPKTQENFKLSTLNIDSLLLSKKEGNVLIGIPKMNYNSEIDIKRLISNYNVNEIFTSKANFSKITTDNISVNKMTQKNSLTIAEKGTIRSHLKQVELTSYEDNYTDKIILNRPYAYLIINNETNDILFIGKVVRVNESS